MKRKENTLFSIQNYSKQNIKNDVLSGALVAVALVPEAIAFSFITGVSPVVGLITAYMYEKDDPRYKVATNV